MPGELQSWAFPRSLKVAAPPAIGQKAPQHKKLRLPKDGKPTIVTFLRHCGCPFAEKTFLSMRDAAFACPGIHFIAISHSDSPSTDHWLQEVGGAGNVSIVVDPERETYAAWGLGTSSFWHVLNPWSLYSVYSLGKQDGIWNRPTESGTRWQSSGSFGVGCEGEIRWSEPNKSANDVPDFEKAIEEVGGGERLTSKL